ncbi:hypothetical protein RxyAA322_19120 [Rubrobacter xylanophilus]|uniref:SPW repeat-containing integral membrane domain-containing protein n=1 Tax=Rubrobacter xylanophilus TaxID=49319 RepID=A0A510HJG8_9ACTN|nr:hypothetical protein [Rubrobacter xylanophilus]BBL80058.1 hypothetical protein RxyAA322_19120 [Rubrobacter xylanophilus]
MWARLLCAVLGAWLMAAPGVLDHGGAAAVSAHVVGPVVLGSSVVAAWPALRPLRWVTLPAGLWLLAAPPLLGYDAVLPAANDMFAGAALAALAFAGGGEREKIGGGWRAVLSGRTTSEDGR